MLAGALTSTPSLAGAQDAYASGLGNLRDTTLSIEQAIQNVNVGYALTYLGGTAGVILFVTGFAEAYQSFSSDVAHMQIGAHHGVLILGVFSMVSSVPDLIEGVGSSVEYLEHLEGTRENRAEE